MKKIAILGAGKIGSLMTLLLLMDAAKNKRYQIVVADANFKGNDIRRIQEVFPALTIFQLDINDNKKVCQFFATQKITAVISCLPFYLNEIVAEIAYKNHCHYFDLTEDVTVTQKIKSLAKNAKTAFVPQCGLAPGMIGVIANSMMGNFEKVSSVKMRVGALPQCSNSALHYALTWSTDGLINEYGNSGVALEEGKLIKTQVLQGLEKIEIDGLPYEAFNTSGGIGSLADLYKDKVLEMNYKTIRYPGHCEKIKFLMNDLKLNEDRATLKRILEKAIPKTYQDIVLIYIAVTGKKQNQFIEESYVKKIYPQLIGGMNWSAIQVATATGALSVLEIVLENPQNYHGFVYQEQIDFNTIITREFGKYYRE